MRPMARRRLDVELVRRGLVDSRSRARQVVMAGDVTVGGAPTTSVARLVAPDEPIEILRPPRYVGRGGEKLEGAIEGFGLSVDGRRCVDVGSSTGGFSDCLLQGGAASVTAIDVGTNQLHERIRTDERVEVHEQIDIRDFAATHPDSTADLVVADLSFISWRTVAAAVVALGQPDADLIALVKPQFEVGADVATRARGVIRDPVAWREALGGGVRALEEAGAVMMGVMVSPLRGAQGNVEFFVHGAITPTSRTTHELDLDAVVATAHERMA